MVSLIQYNYLDGTSSYQWQPGTYVQADIDAANAAQAAGTFASWLASQIVTTVVTVDESTE